MLNAWRSVSMVLTALSLAGCLEGPVMQLPNVPAQGIDADLEAALRTWHTSAEGQPDDSLARGRLAMAYDVNGFAQRAVAVYRQAAALDAEEFKWPYFASLLVAREDADYAGALRLLDAAIAVDDSYVPAWLSRGEWLREVGQASESKYAYARAQTLGAGAPAAIGVARLLLDDGQFGEVVELLEPLNRVTPDPRIEAQLARAYRGLKRDDDARIAAARASGAGSSMQWIDPRLSERSAYIAGFGNRLQHAQSLIQAGRPTDALALAKELVAERPDDVATINTLVWANAALKRLGTVKDLLYDAIDRFPDEPRFHQMLANAYAEEGETTGARQHLERLVELSPNDARGLEALGWLMARQGEPEHGIELLERALASGAREPKQVLYRLGLLEGAQRRWSKAAEHFEAATRIDAAFTMAYVRLGRCLAESGELDRATEALDWANRLGTHANERASAGRRLEALRHSEE